MTNGNEFAAPSTASFGGSNEENLEDATIHRQVLVPATVTSPDALNENEPVQVDQEESLRSPARSMADVIGNAAASAGSTPLSYEMVTMSPVKEAQTPQPEEVKKIPELPNIQDWRSALQPEPDLQITVAKGASPRDGEARSTGLEQSGAGLSGREPVQVEQTADEKLEALLRQRDRPKVQTPQPTGTAGESDGGIIGPFATVPPSSRRQPSRVRPAPGPEPISGPQHFRMDDAASSGPPSPKRSKSPIECRPSSYGPSSTRPQQDGDRLPTRTPVKDVNRDKWREDTKQELDKQRQVDKDAKIEALRRQSATAPAKADEGMEEHAAATGGASDGIAATALRREAEALQAVGEATEALRQRDAELQKERQLRTHEQSQLQAEVLQAAGEATEALRQKDAELQKERQERTHEQSKLHQHFEAVVAQAMQAEGLREKAAAVAAHVAEQVKLYERHSDEQGRKAGMFQAQAAHIAERAQQVVTEREDEMRGTIQQMQKEHGEQLHEVQLKVVNLTTQVNDSRAAHQTLQEALNTKKLEHEDLVHRYNLLEHSSTGALQERTNALNKVTSQEKMIDQQAQTIMELREQAVAKATEASLAKAETAREKERADDWEKNCQMERKRATFSGSEQTQAHAEAAWESERKH